MIIDVHIHSTPGMGRRFLPVLKEECRRNGVSLCLLSSLGVDSWLRDPAPQDIRAANADARKLSLASGGLVLWYGYINPQHSDWRREMDLCAREGAIGFKLWITLKDMHGRLDSAEQVLDHAGRLNLPVLLHTFNRADESLPGEITLPEFTDLARLHPRTRMISAHTGVHWPAETGLFKRLPNAWGDISGGYPLAGQVEALVKEMGADRVLFGSDLTGRSLASQLAKVILADISEADKRKILYQNAVKVFGLKDLFTIKHTQIRSSRSLCHSRENGNPDANIRIPGFPRLLRRSKASWLRPSYAHRSVCFAKAGGWIKAGMTNQLREMSICPIDAAEDHFCFCGQWPFFESACSTPKALDKALAGNGIARAYTAALGSIYRQDLAVANREFLEEVRGFKRIKPLAMINPRNPNWKPTLEKTAPRFAGIILFPFLHNWSLADPRYADLIRWCRKHAIKLWINCRLDDPRFRHTSIVTREVTGEELLRYGSLPHAPETVFQGVFEGTMASFLKRHKKDRRFRFEISRLTDSTGALRAILDKFGDKRLVMGAEYPFRDMAQVRWTSERV